MTAPTQEHPLRSELEPASDRPLRSRPPIDPRIRERRIEVLRAAGRRRLHVTLVIASLIVVLGLTYLMVHSPFLNVDHIRITGARRETPSAIRRATGVQRGDALLFVNAGAVARRLERLPWVAQATVRRELPGTLAIEVEEYVPTAYMRVGPKQVGLIASTGRLIAYAKAAPLHVAQMVGEQTAPAIGEAISRPGAAGVLERLPPRLRAEVQAIDVSEPNIALVLRRTAPAGAPFRSSQVRIGSLADLADKGPAALAVMDHYGTQPFTYIDVSAPQAPVSR